MLSKVVSQKNTLILFAILLIQAIAYNYHEYIMMEPRSIHSWRQSDCLSFALNFYNDRGSFTEPCVNNLGSTNTGKVASDFPIIQYLVGKIWKVTGIQTFIFRIVDLFFLFFGLVFTFKLFRRWFKNESTLAILFTGIIFTSPILSYYGPTSLSDIQALGLSCSAFYFFIVWLEQENNFKYKPLFISVSLFTLAGLLKMSAVFTMLLAISYLISRLLINKSEYKKYLSIKTILAIVLPFIPWFLWYSHAKHYNELNPNGFFLVGILPIWELDMQKIQSIFSMLINEIIPQIIHPYILFSIVGLSAILFISNLRKKKISQALEIIFPYLIFSTYVVLFYQVFDVHDYYMLNMVSLLIVLVGVIIKQLLERYQGLKTDKFIRNGLIFSLLFFTLITSVKTRSRINVERSWPLKETVLHKDLEFLKWNTWYDRSRYEILEDPNFNLENLGVSKNDYVICLGDKTINRSLYLVNRLGYTSFNVDLANAAQFIEEKKKIGLKYLILIEPDWINDETLKPHMKNKIYEYKSTSVYRL